jgi:ribosomal RNA-processing protein 36
VQHKLTKALQSLQSKKLARETRERAQGVLRERKREEKEKIKLGKRPFYLKKREERKLVLDERYSKLGKKKLERVLDRKRKKKEGKEMRRMPKQR